MPAQPKLTLAVALLAVCTVGQGQSALEDSVLWRWVELTDAVVTGERDGTSAKEALRMIRTVDEKSIAASGASQLNQLLNSQLNFRISQDPILGSGAALNGLGGEGLTVLVDGVPVRGRLNGQVDLSQLSLNNVERVEIVNGPMAVEYGTNALAGTINLITKSNHREGLQLTATVSTRPSASTNSIYRQPTAMAKGVTCKPASTSTTSTAGHRRMPCLTDSHRFWQIPVVSHFGTPSCSAPDALVANGNVAIGFLRPR